MFALVKLLLVDYLVCLETEPPNPICLYQFPHLLLRFGAEISNTPHRSNKQEVQVQEMTS